MGRNRMLLLTLCWSLIVVALVAADLEVKDNPDTGLDPKRPPTLDDTSNLNEKSGGLHSSIDSYKVDQVKNDKDQAGGSKEDIEDNKVDKRNPGEQKVADLKGDEMKGEDGLVGKGENKEGDQVEKKGEDGSVGKGENKGGDQVEKKKGEDGLVGKGENKEGDQVEKKRGEDGLVGKGENKEGDQVEKKRGEDGSVGKGENKGGDQVEKKKGEDGSVGKGENKGGDQVEKKKGEDGSVGKGENKVGDQVEKKGEDGSVGKGENKEGDQVEKKGEDGSVGKGENKGGDKVEKKDEGDSVEKGGDKEVLSEGGKGDGKDGLSGGLESNPVRKEGSGGEECDASNSCKAEKGALVACLRVPGNDSPDLSLLIQNKGNNPLSVTILSPNFVQLEKTSVQLRQNEDIKVKVSVSEGGTDYMIALTAGSDNCSLDFRDLTSLNLIKETDYNRKSTFIKLVKKPHLIAFIVFSALLLITALTWMCMSFKRRHFNRNAFKYQKLDMELPVSSGGKVMSDVNDGWDNNWDDNWDDEEAPKTPSMPLTPTVSSKGLAPRRLNKEAWKV